MLPGLPPRRLSAIAVDDLTRQRTWSELANRSQRVARFIRDEVGLRPDDHVAILMENRVEIVELILGSILAGVWITPINWHLRPEEIRYVMADSTSRLLFSSDQYSVTAHQVAQSGASKAEVILAGEDLDAALDRSSDEPPDWDGPAGGNMIYTSGTTGRPKGVKRTRPASVGAALENMVRLGRQVGFQGSDPHLITGPMYHAAPLMFAVYGNAGGAPITIMSSWDERQALALLADREIEHTHLVPTMFTRLLRLPESERAAFSAPSLRTVLHGAAPVAVDVKRRMIDWWGPVLVEYWGATEGGVNTLVGSDDWLSHPGTVGRALPAFEIFAQDAEGKRLADGEVGDLYCRHRHQEQVFEYHGDPEKTARAHPKPGVFTIGDVGFVDGEGWIHLIDRKSNTIISGGVNIYPLEIEQVLQEHPAVVDAGVFGIPDEEWGESVKAAVELKEGFEPSAALEGELLSFVRERVARYKVPRSIDFEPKLPRTASGKLYIRNLREPYWEGRARRI